jgi:amino acid adenylation domain-containing protein
VARLRAILDDLGSGVVLVNGGTPFEEEDLGRTLLRVDGEDSPDPALAGEPVRVEPGDPIYAIYTSGSTGTPKAAVVPHRGIANRFRWMDEYFGAAAAAVVLQTTRHVYDSAVWQLLWPLVNGGRTVLPRSDEELAAEPLAELVRAHGVTMTDFVPSVFNFLVPRLVGEGEIRRSLASLRAVVVGGEQITTATTHAFLGCFPRVRVVNLYGPTEASIGCICYEVTSAEQGRIPIGRPIHNTQALVLDRHQQPIPVGVPGELYLSGACLGIGYLHDEVRTGEVFVENPFPELGCDRMYRTGDRVRWLPDGNLEFLGRVDEQIKIRGFRIEPGEIETALRAHPAVRETVVVAREDSPGQKRLVAYVVPAVAGGIPVAELREHLSTRLPAYMVPGTFVVLERLPLNANGKVDRRALPAPERLRSDEEYVAPRDALELTIAGAWEEVLGISPVGVRDGFFELGGHSLLAVRLIGRIQKLTGQGLPLASLFTAPTVEGLASVLRGGAAGAAARPLVPIQPAGSERPLFFVHAAGENVIGYAELSRHLGSGQPFMGSSPGDWTGTRLHTSAWRRWRPTTWRRSAPCSTGGRTAWAGGPWAGSSRSRWRARRKPRANGWSCWRSWTRPYPPVWRCARSQKRTIRTSWRASPGTWAFPQSGPP